MTKGRLKPKFMKENVFAARLKFWNYLRNWLVDEVLNSLVYDSG